jgi:outer membrane scaffolding protein for murein synthesis (MipA/OmpV family)
MNRLSECCKNCRRLLLLTTIIIACVQNPAAGEEPEPVEKAGAVDEVETVNAAKPLWEMGAGGFAGWIPDYPAAGQTTFRALAVPYIVYRGDILRVGGEESRGAVSGRFFNTDKFEFDISLSAAFPVDSGNNNARRDMPDLDFLFGIGPQFIFKLINEPGKRLNFNLQARSVYSTDFSSVEHRGYVFNPKLSYSREHITALNLKVSTRVGPVFATEQLMDYFYTVDPEFVTPKRPAFDADAGYLGSNFSLSVSRRFNNRFRMIIGTRLGIHHGATNDDSPLFKNNLNVGGFTAFVWSFAQSKESAR